MSIITPPGRSRLRNGSVDCLTLRATVVARAWSGRHRHPQTFAVSALYELPFGPGKALLNHGGVAGFFLGGWQVNGILVKRFAFTCR